MRAQRSGIIITLSSVSGYSPQPGASIFAASKHALEGFGTSLGPELAPFNIRVALVEAGMLRTNFCNHAVFPAKRLSEPYEGGVVQQAQALVEFCRRSPEEFTICLEKLGRRVVEFVDGTGVFREVKERGLQRLILDEDAMMVWKRQLEVLTENVVAMEGIAENADL